MARRGDEDRALAVGALLSEALWAWCHPAAPRRTSVRSMVMVQAAMGDGWAVPIEHVAPAATIADVDALVVRLFQEEGAPLVRLARLFVDDRNAAEDLVQEAFIRLARSAHRITDETKAAAYLRSIVLNLARDHNRRGLVSLRHRPPADDRSAAADDRLELREDQQAVLDALRELPLQQRSCVVLRYYDELGIAAISETLGISENSVKTHLKRGMAALSRRFEGDR
jgi:RNA polymerase sigma factor (sigma-70 family)